MRAITITYSYAGDEGPWREAIQAFIDAIDADEGARGRFTYQVAVADDGKSRVHWGRWDSAEVLQHVQSQDYFRVFAAKVKDFAGGTPTNIGHDVIFRSGGW